ncbi:MAG: hypothetical protein RLZZ296_1868, partial [Pseudomonadota bacterium]
GGRNKVVTKLALKIYQNHRYSL